MKKILTIGRFLTLMAQFIEDEGISEERGWYEWLSCVKNRAKFKMPYSPICDEYLRYTAEVIKGDQISDRLKEGQRDGKSLLARFPCGWRNWVARRVAGGL